MKMKETETMVKVAIGFVAGMVVCGLALALWSRLDRSNPDPITMTLLNPTAEWSQQYPGATEAEKSLYFTLTVLLNTARQHNAKLLEYDTKFYGDPNDAMQGKEEGPSQRRTP